MTPEAFMKRFSSVSVPLRKARSALLLLLLFALPVQGIAPAAAQETLVLRGGLIFDAVHEGVRSNPGVVARGGKILFVGDPEASGLDLSAARTVSLDADQTLLPGFFDVHAHYNVTLLLRPRTEEFHAMPVLYLANGVTSTFPNGEYDPEGMEELRLRVDRGEHPGPRIFNSGPYFGSTRPGWNPDITREQIHAEVDHWVARGVKGFKAKGITPDHLAALIERAHWHGLPVSGHLDSGYRNSVNPADAVRMGIDRIEHFIGGAAFPADRSAYASFPSLTPETPGFREAVELFVRHGVYYSATLTAYGYFGTRDDGVFDHWTDESRFFTPAVRESFPDLDPHRFTARFDSIYRAKCAETRAYHQAGGRLVIGTDHVSTGGHLPQFGFHREMHALVKCGIPAATVLRAATINGARVMRVGDRQGSIEVGKVADLVVIRGNPLDEIRNTRNVEMVVKGGVIYDPAELFRSVEGTLEPPLRPRAGVDGIN